MYDLIRRTLHWVRLFFVPGTGKRRRIHHRPHLCVHITAVRRSPSAPPPPHLPSHRSPYGLVTFLDGTDSVLVRPYLTDTDITPSREAALRHHRHLALALGFDPYLIDAQKVAA
ncbi:hypothetical protein PV396_27865 [Streptomyces sp. ME02-8801-2C]|uniref:hypothetical protein n=1 Tax=Streptomyces sp. ME02-8801-2C TaxID=3028680 RepID=UPI0029BA4528|nr:hypothetical protein [Streptomyces sp. ME02-8801-2C]MDX3455711.1 hypothetical protein [Streptomyces sp. ME02-8801-2C]